MTKKMTKKDHFNMLKAIPEVAQNEILMNFIDHEIELLEKKNSSEKKPTAQQKANESFKAKIVEVLKANKNPMTITEIQKADNELGEMSNQRVSALVRQLKDEGLVERIEDKKKAYFKAV